MRDLSAAVLAEVEAERAVPTILLEAEFTDPATGNISTIRIATTDQNVDVPLSDGRTETFLGGGEFINWGGIQESIEKDRSSVRLRMSGVSQTIMNVLMSHHFRGHEVRLWIAFWNEAAGQVIDQAFQLFDGFQLSAYEIVEDWGGESSEGSVVLETTVESFSTVNRREATVTNLTSHNRFLQRVHQPTGDNFFRLIPGFAGREIFWGRDAPDDSTGGPSKPSGGGGSSSGGGRAGGGDPGDGAADPPGKVHQI